MCGLVGVAGNLAKRDIDIFNQMLVADTFRGHHSTGVASLGLSKTYRPEMLKAVVPGWELQEYKSYDRVVNAQKHFILGHNRHATRGSINKANAHPFFVGDDLVGMQNGSLDMTQTRKFITDLDDFGTDSEAALHSMITRGEKETLENIVGAWAFVWYNYKTNRLNFTRNDKRPLYFAVDHKDGLEGTYDTIWWASEELMLKWILRRNNVQDFKIYDVGELQVVSFEMPETLTGAFKKPKIWKYTEKKYSAPVVPQYGRPTPPRSMIGTSQTGTQDSGKHGSTTTTADLMKLRSIENIKGVLWPDHYEPNDPDSWIHLDDCGEILTEVDEIKDFLKNTDCVICGAHIKPLERWRAFPHRVVVCESCAESDNMDEYLYKEGVAS